MFLKSLFRTNVGHDIPSAVEEKIMVKVRGMIQSCITYQCGALHLRWYFRICKNVHISTTRESMATNFGSVMTYHKTVCDYLPKKSDDPYIIWYLRSRDKLRPLCLCYHTDDGHQTWQDVELPRRAYKATCFFSHLLMAAKLGRVVT